MNESSGGDGQLEKILLELWEKSPVFRDNLAFLANVPLNFLPQQIIDESLKQSEDMYKWNLVSPPPPAALHILDVEETVDLLLENPKSFCRYGDGEIRLMKGHGFPTAFQEHDEKLAARLREILQILNDKCYVAIDGSYFKSTENLPENARDFIRTNGFDLRRELLKYCNRKRLYLAAIFTCFYLNSRYTLREYQIYYEKIKNLFKNRKLIIFSGKTVFDKINHNVFEYAASRQHILAESINAWRQYEEILATARKFPKDEFTLCFILGPTATVAAWDLAQEGYMAWDIGHVAKDYDAFMKKIDQTTENAVKFFAPD